MAKEGTWLGDHLGTPMLLVWVRMLILLGRFQTVVIAFSCCCWCCIFIFWSWLCNKKMDTAQKREIQKVNFYQLLQPLNNLFQSELFSSGEMKKLSMASLAAIRGLTDIRARLTTPTAFTTKPRIPIPLTGALAEWEHCLIHKTLTMMTIEQRLTNKEGRLALGTLGRLQQRSANLSLTRLSRSMRCNRTYLRLIRRWKTREVNQPPFNHARTLKAAYLKWSSTA